MDESKADKRGVLLDELVYSLSFDPRRLGVAALEALVLRLEAWSYLVKDSFDFRLLLGRDGFIATAHPYDIAVSEVADELVV